MTGAREISRLLNAVIEPVVALLTGFFTILLMVAVFSRYVFNISIVESIELTRLAFLWAVFLAAAVVAGRNANIRIEIVAAQLPLRLQAGLQRIVQAVCAVFGVAMVWQGWLLVEKMMVTEMPTLGISQAWLYGGLPVSGALVVVHAVCHMISPSAEKQG